MTWLDALVVDRTTGACQFPNTPVIAPPTDNLLINGDFQINQRSFAGGALAAAAYGHDRWKAAAGGANVSRSGFNLTLSTGGVTQVIEPAVFGFDTLASRIVTLSVEGLATGTLNVAIGSATGTITGGSGRRSVTLTLGAADTGNISVTLTAASGAITFSRVRLETGNRANTWLSRPLPAETLLCQRYFWAPGFIFLLDTFQVQYGYMLLPMAMPVPMRVLPAITFTILQEANIYNGERNITAISTGVIQFTVRAATQARVYAQFGNILLSAEL
jgi:hypothetical protein